MVKLKLEDQLLFGKIIQGLRQRNPNLSEAALSYIILTFAKQKLRDEEYLHWIAKKLLEKVIASLSSRRLIFLT